MESSLKLFCSWVLLMTQPLRLLGNNSGNLSTATTPFTCYYRAALLSTKSVIDIWPLKKGFKVFCIILFLTLSGTEKLEKKPDLLCRCMPSLIPYFRSSKSDIQSFFYESISVLQQQVEGKKSIFATFLSCIDNSIPTGTERQTSTEATLLFTKDLLLADNVTYYSFLALLEGGKETSKDDLLGIRYQKLVFFFPS